MLERLIFLRKTCHLFPAFPSIPSWNKIISTEFHMTSHLHHHFQSFGALVPGSLGLPTTDFNPAPNTSSSSVVFSVGPSRHALQALRRRPSAMLNAKCIFCAHKFPRLPLPFSTRIPVLTLLPRTQEGIVNLSPP